MKKHLLRSAAAAVVFVATPALAANMTFMGSGFSIPDVNPDGASSSIVVGSLGPINSVTVSLDRLSHTYAGDLIATLSNGSATIDLFNRLGVPATTFGNNRNFRGTYSFSDSASASLPEPAGSTNDIIAGGTYKPEGQLANFAGASTAGTWTLKISDRAGADVGSLGGWSLTLDYGSAVPEPGTWAMMILGFGLVGATMRRQRGVRTTVSYA